VGLLGAYEDASNIYLVQELMTGGDLQSVIDEQVWVDVC
jgi:serine/threonine protein kinase